MNSGEDFAISLKEDKEPGDDRSGLILIPAGTYRVGLSQELCAGLVQSSDRAKRWLEKGYFEREQPEHHVVMSTFRLGKYPVTVGEYYQFIVAGGYKAIGLWSPAAWKWLADTDRRHPAAWNTLGWKSSARLPMTGVSWYEAQAYCLWLSETKGRSYRLPTEVEWEVAARGPEGYLYPWGNDFDYGRCNFVGSEISRPTTVGAFSPEGDAPWGHVDMAGNVSEWTSSFFQPYQGLHKTTVTEDQDYERVTRGGSWRSPALRLRNTARGYNAPSFYDDDLGFRLATDG